MREKNVKIYGGKNKMEGWIIIINKYLEQRYNEPNISAFIITKGIVGTSRKNEQYKAVKNDT